MTLGWSRLYDEVSYEASMQFNNSHDYGSVGAVLGLTPADGNPVIAALFDIPRAGDDIIWTASTGDANKMWADHTQIPNEKLSVSSTVGA